MRVLVTGQRGNIGTPVAGLLTGSGHEVAGFDLADGMDLLDLAAVRDAAAGCTAIVHLAALANDIAGSPEQIMAVNVLGTWHVLLAAEAAGVTRVVYMSSAQVFRTTSQSMTPIPAARCARTACPSAWPRICVRASPPGPGS
jgi:UDP-glucose 4-epimerase